MSESKKPATLDPLIHEAARLAMVAALAACDRANFNFMLGVTGLTRGNFSTHMNRLVQAGYVEEIKGYAGRRPLTEYRLTEAGSRAYAQYRRAWKVLTGDG